ncbi:MAG: amidohydrolase family protein [Bacteroidetes bacterium]|nr:amidohydrolase family protein [Bacteroidota bacterium]
MKMSFLISFFCLSLSAQEVPIPAPKKQGAAVLVKNAIIHIGNGQLIERGFLIFENGRISSVTSGEAPVFEGEVIDAAGKHVYPGLIALNTPLGLIEIDAVRATRDQSESGEINPNVRAIVGYNTDSRVTPTVRSNGILLAQVAPQDAMMSGLSSVVELDGWNWEDAVYKKDDAVYLDWPKMSVINAWWAPPADEQKKTMEKKLSELSRAMEDAYSYFKASNAKEPIKVDLRWEAMVPVFEKKRAVFIRASHIKQIRAAISLARKYDLRIVLVGANDAYLALDLLKENNIPVVLEDTHGLPGREDEASDLYYRLPKMLTDAGILCAVNVKFSLGGNGPWNERNLPFQAGQTAAYGLSKEEALKCVTSYPARILGIDKTVGTVEEGKDATFLICGGDLLDMKSSSVEYAFVRGRMIDLGNKQIDLYNKFKAKYEKAE